MTKSKNVLALRIGLVALVIAAIGAFVVGVTYAKYVKEVNQGNISSTVAGFGVTLAWETSDTFKTTYTNTQGGTITNTVTSADTDKVIAPGTSGSLTLTISGSSEVAFTLAFSFTETYSANWKESADAEAQDYHPIVLTATKKVGEGEATSVTLNSGASYTESYQPGTIATTVYTITWNWPFEVEGNDDADTYIASLGTLPTYTLEGTASATQGTTAA